jgi:hypothetical protein
MAGDVTHSLGKDVENPAYPLGLIKMLFGHDANMGRVAKER